jgi:hypothetical protein
MYDRYDSEGTYTYHVPRPARLAVPGGVAIPPTEEQLNTAGYYRAVNETPPGPGYVGRGTRTRRIEGGVSINGWSEWVSPQQQAAETDAAARARIANIVMGYRAQLGMIAAFAESLHVPILPDGREIDEIVQAANEASVAAQAAGDLDTAISIMRNGQVVAMMMQGLIAAGVTEHDIFEALKMMEDEQ